MSAAPASRSIRSRLQRSLLLGLGLVLLLGGVALFVFVRVILTAQFDDGLSAKARSLASAVRIEAGTGRIEFELAGGAMPEFERSHAPEYFQLWSLSDGGTSTTAEKSVSLKGADLPVKPDATSVPADLPLPDGRSGRCVWLEFSPGPDREDESDPSAPDKPAPAAAVPQRMMLALATSRAELDRPLKALLVALLGTGVLICLGATVAVRRSLATGLAPIDDLAGAVAAIRPDALPSSIGLASLPNELEPVRLRLDELLARVRSALDRERRFTAAAAHELRTPLAELHSLLDVRLKWPEDIENCIASMTAARGVTTRIERLVEVLLVLARAENGRADLQAGAVDLAGEVRTALARRSGEIGAKRLQVQMEAPAVMSCRGDSAAVASIVENLVANAIEYTPPGGWMRIECAARGGEVELAIANGPTELGSGDVGRMFETFWRRDAARGQTGEHLGLGLALVDALARGMGGAVAAEAERDGLRIAVRLRP